MVLGSQTPAASSEQDSRLIKLVCWPEISGLKDYLERLITLLDAEQAALGSGAFCSPVRTLKLRVDVVTDEFLRGLAAADPRSPRSVIFAPVYEEPSGSRLRDVGVVLQGLTTPPVVIYPDQRLPGLLVSSPEKIWDTVRCYADLPRYSSLHRSEPIAPDLLNEFGPELQRAGRKLMKLGLNDQSRSGSISIRLSSEEFLITATKTPKALVGDRICMVHGFDSERQELSWSGHFPPSASTPMHAAIYRRFPEATAIVHTHSRQLTYSSHLERFRTASFVPDGVSASLFEVLDLLEHSPVVIMRGHGEIAVGRSLDEAIQNIASLREIV